MTSETLLHRHKALEARRKMLLQRMDLEFELETPKPPTYQKPKGKGFMVKLLSKLRQFRP